MSLDTPKATIPLSGDAMKHFQLDVVSIKDKSSREYGLAISKYIAATASFNQGGYYFNRNARLIKNRNYSHGRIDIQAMFQDRFQFDAKQNYIFLNWNALQLCNRIITGLVGRWMKRSEKVQVKAIDSLSQADKQSELDNIEFIIENKQKLEQLQQESGVQVIPDNIPADKEELNIWRTELQKLPEEISGEMICNDVLESNGFYSTQKEKCLHDSAETSFVGTYTWMDTDGIIHVRRVKPENAIYSYSEEDDLRDTSWRGEAPSVKISELRRQWGKEFNPDNPFALTEEQIWKIAQGAKEFQYQSNISWNDLYVTAFLRPYDEWNIKSIQFEVKTVDSEPYTVTKTKTNSTYVDKGMPTTASGNQKLKPSTNQNIIGDTNWNIYRGVYLPDSQTLLEWSLKDNMIRPQDPKEIGNAEFSYSFYILQNYLARSLAIPEKIEAAIDGMILACLKVQQDIATSIPPGWAIDEDALQNIDYGLGDEGNKGVNYVKQYWQTGKLWYRGLDAEGNRRPVPIQEIANSGFLNHIQAFITTYEFWYKSLKDELGEDPSLITAALQPRVTADNVQVSQTTSEYATDVYYRAYAECMKITSRKISCLAKDSVKYSASAYRHLVQSEDFDKRIFTTDIRFLPTEMEIQTFVNMMNQVVLSQPEMVMFVDPFQLTRVAKEDVKLAEALFRQGQKKMLIWKQQTQQENIQQTIDGQVKSAQAAEQAKQQTLQMQLETEGQQAEMQGKIDKEKINLQGVWSFINTYYAPQKSGGEGAGTTTPTLPTEVQQLLSLAMKNIAIPLAVDNQGMVEGLQQQSIEQQAQAEGEQPEQEMQEQQNINQQQPQVAA